MNEVRNVMVGMAMDADSCQLAYFDRRAEEPMLVPYKTATNVFRFPTALDADEEGRLVIGKGELRAKREDGTVIPFFEAFSEEEPLSVGTATMEPAELLAAFIGEAVALMRLKDPMRSIAGFIFTTKELKAPFVRNLRKAFGLCGFPRGTAGMQDYMESFYYYAYSQPEDFRRGEVMLFNVGEEEAESWALEESDDVRPHPVKSVKVEECALPARPHERDEAFQRFIASSTENRKVTGILITGDGFGTDWSVRSQQELVKGRRRVFYGDSLFVKGACYAAIERRERHRFRTRVYDSDQILKAGLGMDMMLGGNPTYYPLLRPGVNWFEAAGGCEFLIDGKNELIFYLHRGEEGKRTNYRMPLDGLPSRPPKTSRIRLSVTCENAGTIRIQAEDLGFGELYPATHKVWTEMIEI